MDAQTLAQQKAYQQAANAAGNQQLNSMNQYGNLANMNDQMTQQQYMNYLQSGNAAQQLNQTRNMGGITSADSLGAMQANTQLTGQNNMATNYTNMIDTGLGLDINSIQYQQQLQAAQAAAAQGNPVTNFIKSYTPAGWLGFYG